jgi:hypothetical protein
MYNLCNNVYHNPNISQEEYNITTYFCWLSRPFVQVSAPIYKERCDGTIIKRVELGKDVGL